MCDGGGTSGGSRSTGPTSGPDRNGLCDRQHGNGMCECGHFPELPADPGPVLAAQRWMRWVKGVMCSASA